MKKSPFLLILALVLALLPSAHAANVTWIGALNTYWATAADWSSAGGAVVPGPADDVTFTMSNNAYAGAAGASYSGTVNSLTISNSGTGAELFTLNGNSAVSGFSSALNVTGTLSLTGSNTYIQTVAGSGPSTLNVGSLQMGTTGVNYSNYLRLGSAITLSVGGGSGSITNMGTGTAVIEIDCAQSAFNLASASVTNLDIGTINTNATFTINAGQTYTLSNRVTLGRSNATTNNGSGTLTLNGGTLKANTFNFNSLAAGTSNLETSTFTLNGGTLTVGLTAGGVIQKDANGSGQVFNFNGGTVSTSGSQTLTFQIGTNATTNFVVSLSGTGTHILDCNGKNISFTSAAILADQAGQAGTLIATNSGVGGAVILQGINTYTGSTTISGTGTKLKLSNAGSIDSSSVITIGDTTAATAANLDVSIKTGGLTVGAGQTINGFGQVVGITGVTTTVNGVWAPGLSGTIGTLSVTNVGSLTLSGTTKVKLGTPGSGAAAPGTSDKTVLTGTLALGGALVLSDNGGVNSNGSLGAGVYKIATYGSAGGTQLTGAFSSIIDVAGYRARTVANGGGTTGTYGLFLENYLLAGAAASQTLSLGNFHVGEGKTVAVTLSNTATATYTTYVETLSSGSFSSTTSGFTATGSVTGISAASSGSGTLQVGVDAGAGAGAQNGLTILALNSDAVNSSGLGSISAGSQTINISGTGYRLASANTLGDVNFGNFHVGTAQSTLLSATNTATADGFSEKLVVSGSATGAASFSGGATLVAGSSTGLTIGLTDVAGAQSDTVAVSLTSDGAGTSGLGTTALTGETVNVSGVGYRYASANTLGNVNFGSFHVGTAQSTVLSASNTAIADGYSEKLAVSGSATGAASFSGGATVAAGSSTGLTIGLTDAVGAQSGTVAVSLTSEGAGTSGLGTTALTGETVNVSGTGYNLASADATQTVNVGITHVGVAKSGTVTVANTAPVNATYTETLSSNGFSGTTAGFSASGSVSGIAGGSNGSGTLQVTMGSGFGAGAHSGTTSLALNSDAVNSSGLGTTALSSQLITINGQVNEFAAPALTKASGDGALSTIDAATYSLDLGKFTINTGVHGATLALSNTLVNAIYQDLLSGNFTTTGLNGFSFSVEGGSLGDIAIGGSNSLLLSFDTTGVTAGNYTGQVVFNPLSINGSETSNLSAITVDLQLQATSIPEPTTWAMLVGGLGMLTLSQRIRRRISK